MAQVEARAAISQWACCHCCCQLWDRSNEVTCRTELRVHAGAVIGQPCFTNWSILFLHSVIPCRAEAPIAGVHFWEISVYHCGILECLLSWFLPPALMWKTMQSPTSVYLSVCFHSVFGTDWPLTVNICIWVDHGHSSQGIEDRGHGSRLWWSWCGRSDLVQEQSFLVLLL